MNNLERGTRLSQSVKWQGQDIFEIAQAAFEDANYHTFNEVFTEAWNEFNKEMDADIENQCCEFEEENENDI